MRFILLPILLLPVLAGCMTPSPPMSQSPSIEWGLGLDLAGSFQPATFAEPPSEIRKLRDFLANTTNELMALCESTDRGNIDGYLPHEYYLDALASVPDSCNSGTRAKADLLAPQLVANGTVDSVLDRLQADAKVEVEASRERVDALPQIRGSIVDLEVASIIYTIQSGAEGRLKGSEMFQQAYRNSTDELSLVSALLNAINAQRIASISLPWIIEEYPWAAGTCQPETHVIEARLSALIEQMDRVPRPWPEIEDHQPEDWDDLIDNQKRIWDDFREQDRATYNSNMERNLLPKVLSNIVALSWNLHFVQAQSPLPTRAEAQYLFDTYRNQTRSLLTDRFLQHWLLDGLQDYRGSLWMQYGGGKAAYAKVVFEMNWPIDALHCPPL